MDGLDDAADAAAASVFVIVCSSNSAALSKQDEAQTAWNLSNILKSES